jgi:hypothetical protein
MIRPAGRAGLAGLDYYGALKTVGVGCPKRSCVGKIATVAGGHLKREGDWILSK